MYYSANDNLNDTMNANDEFAANIEGFICAQVAIDNNELFNERKAMDFSENATGSKLGDVSDSSTWELI